MNHKGNGINNNTAGSPTTKVCCEKCKNLNWDWDWEPEERCMFLLKGCCHSPVQRLGEEAFEERLESNRIHGEIAKNIKIPAELLPHKEKEPDGLGEAVRDICAIPYRAKSEVRRIIKSLLQKYEKTP